MSLNEIFDYINKKQKWIEERQNSIKSILHKNYELINYEKLLFLGKQYDVCMTKNIEKSYLTSNQIIIEKTSSLNSVKSQIKEFLMESCDKVLVPRICEISRKIGVSFKQIKIVSSKAKWGMCDSKKCLYFNYKMLMLPHEIIDYIIVHELCHLLELNHSKNFWKLVGKI
ncbi:MAG: DUF45 domain-containing protein, partial [Clostridiales bacterium]|nr:DUF45 domain-containing protein [Candidatus Apopatousia equi]